MKELRELVQIKNETWDAIETAIQRLNRRDHEYQLACEYIADAGGNMTWYETNDGVDIWLDGKLIFTDSVVRP